MNIDKTKQLLWERLFDTKDILFDYAISSIDVLEDRNKKLNKNINTLNKGIDELVKKYENEKELIWHDIMCNKKDNPTYNRLSGELTQVNQILEDLKKLKGE